MEHKIYEMQLKSADEKALAVTAVISNERPDRQSDIMRARGMRTDSDKIPVLFSHGMGPLGSEPVGKITRLWVDQWKGYPGIFAGITMYPDEVGTRLYDKMVNGFLNSWSIGFIINDYKRLENGGRDVIDWTLMEASATPTPANADTTTLIEKGIFEGLEMKFLRPGEKIIPTVHIDDLLVSRIIKETCKREIDRMRGRVS